MFRGKMLENMLTFDFWLQVSQVIQFSQVSQVS